MADWEWKFLESHLEGYFILIATNIEKPFSHKQLNQNTITIFFKMPGMFVSN